MTFARVDGRNVISLPFNPYNISDPNDKKVYDSTMKEYNEQKNNMKLL
jgi:hypothetical protein